MKSLPQKRWFTGEEIISLGVQSFELLNAVKTSKLTPYNDKGCKILEKDNLPKKKLSLDEIALAIRVNDKREQAIDNGRVTPSIRKFKPLTEDEIIAKARREYENQEGTPIIPEDCIAVHFSDNNVLMFLYKHDEVKTFINELNKDVIEDKNAVFKNISDMTLREALGFPEEEKTQKRFTLRDALAGYMAEDKNPFAVKSTSISKIIKTAEPVTGNNFFRHERDFWKIGYEGKEATIKYSKGLHYIALLLSNPEETISYLDLCHAVDPPEGKKIQLREATDEGLFIAERSKDIEAINTPETIENLKKELVRLISENDNEDDLERDPLIVAENEKRIADIEKSLKEGSFENKAYSKTQESVSKAIKRAYKELSDNNMSELVKYLKNNKITLIKKHGYMYSGTPWKIK